MRMRDEDERRVDSEARFVHKQRNLMPRSPARSGNDKCVIIS